MEKKFKIQKVPLESLLTLLNSLWVDGAEFVDVDVTLSSLKDRVEVSARDEYFTAIPLSFLFSKEEYEELIYLGTDGSKEK